MKESKTQLQDEDDSSKLDQRSDALPVLPLKDIVMFPGIIAPIFVGREKSLRALIASKKIVDEQGIILVTQKDQKTEDPNVKDLYSVGVLAKVIQTVKLPNNTAKILVEAVSRVLLYDVLKKEYFTSRYEVILDKEVANLEVLQQETQKSIDAFKEYIKINKKINPETLLALTEQKNPGYIINILASHISCNISLKQSLLEQVDPQVRAALIIKYMQNELAEINIEHQVQQRVKKQIEKNQRDYYLQEQMKAIKKELEGEEDKSEFSELEKKIKTIKLSKEAKEKAESELKKLRNMNPVSAESSVTRNYLDTLLGMPWGKFDAGNIDIKKTQEILDRDHYGLEKIKERIVEYLSVLQRSKKIKGPILCFIGPPGVGKTSLVKSIANAMGREYTKFALGGVRDEAEIRGHRKTYLGSMPGRIISLIKKAKVNNPVMLLDEVDKISSDFRGDPASALLEVLDPEQNLHFTDNYLEVEYDLSNVIFIATANSYNVPRALLDRMEIINIAGYVEEEKMKIAKHYLIPKQLKAHGMKKNELKIKDDALLEIIRYYTKESGVRAVERDIGALCRKALKKILSDNSIKSITIEANDLEEYLGVKKYRFGIVEKEDQVGATMGLAYTEVGGDLLTIEALSFPGKGEIKTTGKLGDVMKESAQAAYSCFRSRATAYGLKYESYKDLDIHLHVPEGAIPKDGPSAGTAIFTTIMSLMTNIPVKRTVAMTGEITLRGKVLPIGGLKEKLLAASRGGIKTVIIPEDNVRDLKEIPNNIKSSLEILPVNNIDQVLDFALVEKLNDTNSQN